VTRWLWLAKIFSCFSPKSFWTDETEYMYQRGGVFQLIWEILF
jgi:hypothetical protein